MKFAYVHIPKTAGTTMENLFRLDNKVCHIDKNVQPRDINNYDICFGHFHPEVYKGYPLITWFRDPIDRVISHYSYWRNNGTHKPIIVNPGKWVHFDNRLDIVSFTESIGNLLVEYTSSDLEQFEFIGIVEKMEYSLNYLFKKYNLKLPSKIPTKRKGNPINISDKKRNKLKELLNEDIELYNIIEKRFN